MKAEDRTLQKQAPSWRILTIKAVLAIIPISRRHLYRLEATNRFPKRIPIGPRRRGYLEADIHEWMEACKQEAKER